VDQEFGISEERRDGSSVVSPWGEVDVATAPALRDRLEQVIESDQGPVVVDLTAVTFIDSTGLGVLIGARKQCDDNGRALRVVMSEPRILKVFEITGLTEFFDVQPSLGPALRG
jgi:anti-sigma B factor antagonist